MADPTPSPQLEEDLPHWEDDPDLYDTLFLGGEQIVGICTVKVSRKVKIDKKSAKGKNKAVVTKQGVEPAEVTITVRVLDRADFKKLQSQMELFEPLTKWKEDSHGDALDIAHWATKMRGIEAIIVESADGPELKDGILELTIKAVEFKKPEVTTGKGGGSGGGLRFGFFYDQTGQPLPLSYVAIEGLPAKIDNPNGKDNGKPLLDPQGHQIFVCEQKAILLEIGLNEVSTTFLGRYVAFDPLIKSKWEEFHPPEKDKDVTKTPDKSKGGANLGDFTPSDNDTPDPTTTDAGP